MELNYGLAFIYILLIDFLLIYEISYFKVDL